MNKPASGRPAIVDFSQAGKRRRHQRRGQRNSTADTTAGKPTEVQNRSTDGLLKYIEQESVVDKEKVRKIKAAISAGTYKVNAETIAEKLVELEVELIEAPPKDR